MDSFLEEEVKRLHAQLGGPATSSVPQQSNQATGHDRYQHPAPSRPQPMLVPTQTHGLAIASPILSRPAKPGMSELPDPSPPRPPRPVAPAANGNSSTARRGSDSQRPAAAAEEEKGKVLDKKEQAVRQALRSKQISLQVEAKRLAELDVELAKMSMEYQADINSLRRSLEVIDKDVAYLSRDAKRKKELYDTAQAALDVKLAEKNGITERLTDLILASEKKKDQKLTQLMRQMEQRAAQTGDGNAPAAAPQQRR